jgi:hypothetical protein
MRVGQRSQEVEENLDAVTAEVRHRPASGLGAAEEPGPRVLGPGIEGLERLHGREHGVAELAFVQERAQPAHERVVVAVVSDGETHAVLPRGRDHALAGGGIERHRLLAEDMLARLRRRHRLLGVEPHGCRHVDGVDPLVAHELAPVGVRASRPVAGRELRGLLRLGPGHRDERAVGGFAERGGDPLLRDVAAAHEPPADRVEPGHGATCSVNTAPVQAASPRRLADARMPALHREVIGP